MELSLTSKELRLNGWLFHAVCVAILMGTGFPRDSVQAAPPPASGPALQITPTAVTFPPQAVDTVSPPQVITLTSTGSTQVQISDIYISGIDFADTHNCGANLPAGASCSISITCKPATVGPRLGTISIVSSDPGSPRLVPLNATGK
jgi:hypothetical protein